MTDLNQNNGFHLDPANPITSLTMSTDNVTLNPDNSKSAVEIKREDLFADVPLTPPHTHSSDTSPPIISDSNPESPICIRVWPPKNWVQMPVEKALALGYCYIPSGSTTPRQCVLKGYGKLGQDEATLANGTKVSLRDLNSKAWSIYSTPNYTSNHKDSGVLSCTVLFAEHDKLTKDERLALIAKLTKEGFKPSWIVETRNSDHIYLRLKEAISPDQWRLLTKRLIKHLDSDPSVSNPSRCMRLAGYDHTTYNAETGLIERVLVKEVGRNNAAYTFEQLDEFLPQLTAKSKSESKPSKPSVVYAKAPISELRKTLMEKLDVERADNRDQWRRVTMGLHHETNGSEEGRVLAHEFSARSAKYNAAEVDRDWDSYDSSKPNPATWATVKLWASLDTPEVIPVIFSVYEVAYQALFKKEQIWAAVDAAPYLWVETHFERKELAEFEAVVNEYCRNLQSFRPETKEKPAAYVFPLANPNQMRLVSEYCLRCLQVPAKSVNPFDILNCTNGYLKLSFGSTLTWELIKHTPDYFVTAAPGTTYDPDADTTELDNMLRCIDSDKQEAVLRTLAAALNLAHVRASRGRAVKGLLLVGSGSNGKDVLRIAISLLLGVSCTSASLGDFQDYDQRRKFGLSQLLGSKINWPSESTGLIQLDRLQALKAVLSGDQITIEGKGRDGVPYSPSCLCVFNTNDMPNIHGGQEAIKTRFAILKMTKTFKTKPDASRADELQADPRFHDNTEWLSANVLPALLNRLLKEYQDLLAEGIDYSPLDAAMEEAQQESFHLRDFCKDAGIVEDSKGLVKASTVFDKLQKWYRGPGGMVNPEDPSLKPDTGRLSDKAIAVPHQLFKKLLEIFPHIEKGPRTNDSYYIHGITLPH